MDTSEAETLTSLTLGDMVEVGCCDEVGLSRGLGINGTDGWLSASRKR